MRVLLRVCAVTALSTALLAATLPAAHAEEDGPKTPPTGTVRVAAADSAEVNAQASTLVAAMSVEERAATVVMGHIPTTDAATLRAYMTESGIGGFILMGANIPGSEAELRALTTALTADPALPPLIAIDEEGGDVRRLPWDTFPGADTLKFEPPAATQEAFAGRGALVERAGIGVNFGIVADVEDSTSSFIFRRSLGTTPDAAAERVSAAVVGEGTQVASTLKHFPGHGAPEGDSHSVIPETGISYAEWVAGHAPPFQAGIDAGAPLLMFGHLTYTAIDPAPASVSAEWHRIAREELGFTGVAITDDLGMLQASGRPEFADPVANAVASLRAGNDMVLTVMFSTPETATATVSGIVAAVETGALASERLEEAATAVTRLRLAAVGSVAVPCADCTAAE